MAIQLSEDGRVERFSMTFTTAAAQTLSASAADLAAQIDAAREKRETEARDDLTYAQNATAVGIEAQVRELTKSKELEKLRAPTTADPLHPSKTKRRQSTRRSRFLKGHWQGGCCRTRCKALMLMQRRYCGFLAAAKP